MGRIARPAGAETTRYYWYPGERGEWARAGLAVCAGLLVFGVIGLFGRSMLAAVTAGAGVTATLAGFNFGRRDLRAAGEFPEPPGTGREAATQRGRARAARRMAVRHASRALWRGVVQGAGAALLALLVANLGPRGTAADWVLPVLPVLLGAVAHQAGMGYERLTQVPRPPVPPLRALPVRRPLGGTPVEPDPAERPALRLASYRGVPPTSAR